MPVIPLAVGDSIIRHLSDSESLLEKVKGSLPGYDTDATKRAWVKEENEADLLFAADKIVKDFRTKKNNSNKRLCLNEWNHIAWTKPHKHWSGIYKAIIMTQIATLWWRKCFWVPSADFTYIQFYHGDKNTPTGEVWIEDMDSGVWTVKVSLTDEINRSVVEYGALSLVQMLLDLVGGPGDRVEPFALNEAGKGLRRKIDTVN